MKHRIAKSTIEMRRNIYGGTIELSRLWKDMTVEQIKAEYLRLGGCPALVTEDRDEAIRWLYLSQMKRMIGD